MSRPRTSDSRWGCALTQTRTAGGVGWRPTANTSAGASTTPRERPLDSKLLLKTLMAMRHGDFTVRLPMDRTGVAGKIYDAINEIIDLNQRMAGEIDRVSVAVGKEGKITQRAALSGSTGAWADTIGSVNSLIADPTEQFFAGCNPTLNEGNLKREEATLGALVESGELAGVADMSDLTDRRNGLRIVVTAKRLPAPKLDTIVVTAPRIASRA